MRSIPRALRAMLLTVVIGGVALGACLAALIPGTVTLLASHHYTSDKLGNLKALAQRSTIYDSKFNVLAQLGLENREDVQLKEVPQIIQELQAEMMEKAEEMDFEGAAMLRDKIQAIKDLDLGIMPKSPAALRAAAPENASKAGRAGARPERAGKKRAGGRKR